MHVTEHLAKAKDTLVSFEVLPPLKGRTISYIYEHLDPLMEFKPSWINVTYHRSETLIRKNENGVEEKVDVRKRPGTVGICAAIMNHYNVDAVPHIICGGFSKRETEDALIDLQFLGIDNVLVLRGDAEKGQKTFVPEPNGNQQAIDLLNQVMGLNNGEYLDKEISYRQAVAKVYLNEINNDKIITPTVTASQGHVWHLFTVRVKDRKHFQEYLTVNNIQTVIHYPVPPHKQPAYKEFNNLHLPLSEQIHEEIISLPISSIIPDNEIKHIIETVNNY